MRNQKGFTLIELVVVIVILGILAAVAVPKFVDMQSDARVSSLKALYGSVRSASALAHAQALVKGETAATGAISMEGTPIDLAYGYPSLTGIRAAVTISDDYSYDNSTGVFTLDGGTDCTVTYTAATSTTTPPDITISDTCQ